MRKLRKGSPEAKAWGRKMRALRGRGRRTTKSARNPLLIHRAGLRGGPMCGMRGACRLSTSGVGVTCPACLERSKTLGRDEAMRQIERAAKKNPAMQAISTEYFGPTNTRGPRIVAKTGSGIRLSVKLPPEVDSGESGHRYAAEALQAKMKWPGRLIGGGTGKGFCWVFAESHGNPRSGAFAKKRLTGTPFLIYNCIREIWAYKEKHPRLKSKTPYRHVFSRGSRVQVWGLPDGTVLLKSALGKPLFKKGSD